LNTGQPRLPENKEAAKVLLALAAIEC